ncbi:MAG: NAD(P)H-dependent flavin oxidoreductase [Flavobacteriales bacterium]|jgi:enoyl-[acyl-carrier protein] reductase II
MNRVKSLFNISHPIVQGGMIWCSGWELASAVSNAGGLGLIGSGSMYPEVLELHIQRCKQATQNPFGVNVPLLYPNIEQHLDLIIKHEVPIVFTSAGNPKTHTKRLKEAGITVVHVVSSKKFALKAQDAGVDAVVAEGFEAGGHNGREETTTLCLIPSVREAIDIPLIAAGGIGSGKAMLAAMILGADGVQVGSRFLASHESSAHIDFKKRVLQAEEGETKLTLKELTPVRLLDNAFSREIEAIYERKGTTEALAAHLGRGRAKKGMFEGDLVNGELEVGQVSSMIKEIKPASDIVKELMEEYHRALTAKTLLL